MDTHKDDMSKHNDETRSRRPNLRTVAKHVKLSPATVSLALRGDTSIPPETRERVVAAAEELNYEYVPRAQKMKQTRFRRITFVMHDHGDRPVTANPFYGHILSSTEEACREKHVGLSFVIVRYDHPPITMLPSVLKHDVDGIILAGPYPVPLIRRISRESACPVVLIDNVFPGCPHDSVMSDDFGGAHQIVSYLLEQGHTDIAVLTGDIENVAAIPSFQERYHGYTVACAEGNVSSRPPIFVPVKVHPYPESDIEAMTNWVQELLLRNPEITAFFGIADRFATSFMAGLRKLGIDIPGKISVAGFDDVPEAASCRPSLTTIHSYRDLMAKLAVRRLLDRINGDDTPPQHIKVGTKLLVRESTGPVSDSPK